MWPQDNKHGIGPVTAAAGGGPVHYKETGGPEPPIRGSPPDQRVSCGFVQRFIRVLPVKVHQLVWPTPDAWHVVATLIPAFSFLRKVLRRSMTTLTSYHTIWITNLLVVNPGL